jgi:hypothetical protein
MQNLNSPQIIRGPLLAHEMHRVTVVCPPCTGECNQGRQCAANTPAEACTDIGADPDPYDGTAVIRGLMSAIGITAVIAAIVAVAV